MSWITEIWQWLASFLPPAELEIDVGAISNTISTLAIVLGGGWTLWMLRREIRNLEQTNRASHYSELDRNYTEILLQAIERPYLRDQLKIEHFLKWGETPSKRSAATRQYAKTDAEFTDQANAYQAYAFICMNFVEAIRDRCVESTTSYFPFGILKKPDLVLTKTWQPIIASEIRLHSAWFDQESEHWCCGSPGIKFCLGFCDFVWSRRWMKSDATNWTDRPVRAIWKDSIREICRCDECRISGDNWVQRRVRPLRRSAVRPTAN